MNTKGRNWRNWPDATLCRHLAFIHFGFTVFFSQSVANKYFKVSDIFTGSFKARRPPRTSMILKTGLNLPRPRFSRPAIQGPCQPQVSPAELTRPQERHLITMLVQAKVKANRGCSPRMELTLGSTRRWRQRPPPPPRRAEQYENVI